EVKAAAKSNASHSAGKPKNTNGFWINLGIVLLMVALGFIVFFVLLGSPSNFSDPEKKVPLNWMGNMYHAGFIIALLISMLFITITFILERAFTIIKAKGKTNGAEFVRKVQYHLANKNVDAAISECDKQSGSVGN